MWTKVEDGLPAEYDYYQVCYFNKHIEQWIVRAAWFLAVGTFVYSGQYFPATHWAPLLTPPSSP